jgi:tRNA dimethylallyltransferase
VKKLPLVVIVGPTASGKTSLAVTLAKEYSGEIISADSRAIYKGLDIGTAKPSLKERRGVPHWGIDIVGPEQTFSVADFQRYAKKVIRDIRSRGKIPFLVGGSGLYVDSVVYDYDFSASGYDTAERETLMEQDLEVLYKYCDKHNVKLPENHKNKRYVVNNILRSNAPQQRKTSPQEGCIVVGITTEINVLRERITSRARAMWDAGLIEETHSAAARYGWKHEAMTGNTYCAARAYIEGTLSRDEAIARVATLDSQLAKRQRTWLRRHEHIIWFGLEDAHTYLAQHLAACRDL